MSVERTDLLGRPLTNAERRLADVYDELKSLVREPADVPPCALANLRGALACVAVVVTDLGIAFEHLIDDGC
jgi:hypothetical protein